MLTGGLCTGAPARGGTTHVLRGSRRESYFGVDYDLVWDVVINKISALQREGEHILRQEGTA